MSNIGTQSDKLSQEIFIIECQPKLLTYITLFSQFHYRYNWSVDCAIKVVRNTFPKFILEKTKVCMETSLRHSKCSSACIKFQSSFTAKSIRSTSQGHCLLQWSPGAPMTAVFTLLTALNRCYDCPALGHVIARLQNLG